jgi:hypothetical protein
MGYTHYWYKPEKLSPELWKKFTDDFKTILPHFEILLDNDEIIFFNGVGEYSHETFCLERIDSEFERRLNKDESLSFSFCKTARKPYDIAVCCALIIGAKHLPIRVESDGDEEWEDAKMLCQETLGYGERFRFDSEYKLVEVKV